MYGQRLYAKLVRHLEGKGVFNPSLSLNSIFWISLECFRQAVRCLDTELYESTTVMCRAALDSAIFEALVKRPVESGIANYAEWDLKQMDNITKDYFSMSMAEPNQRKRKRILTKGVKAIRNINWKVLRRNAIKQNLLKAHELGRINSVRGLGDFSVHLATSLMKDFLEATKAERPMRTKMFEKDAKSALTRTEKWLEKIADRYHQAFYVKDAY